jgi:hypothetical protein
MTDLIDRITEPQEWIDGLLKVYAPNSEDIDVALQNMELKIRELQKDKIRLDWLAYTGQSIGNVQLPRECVERNVGSLRGAIDDAMSL